MKYFKEYIIEKLKLDNDTEFKDYSGVKKIYLPSPEPRDFAKMNEYKKKGSKPLTLVHTIKDRGKLLRRFQVALQIKWDEAVKTFSDAIIDRGYYTREEINKYISEY